MYKAVLSLAHLIERMVVKVVVALAVVVVAVVVL